jgi:hypothetical protein
LPEQPAGRTSDRTVLNRNTSTLDTDADIVALVKRRDGNHAAHDHQKELGY